MSTAILFILHQIFQSTYSEINFQQLDATHVNLCVARLISSLNKGVKVTYIDNGYEDIEVIKVLNEINHVTIVSRTTDWTMESENEVYVISVAEANRINGILEKLKHETGWRPDAKFILVLSTHENSPSETFNALLHYRVTDVVIVKGTVNPELLTYNPFENNACGKWFDRISHAKCLEADSVHFPRFNPSELRNCSFRAMITQSPPFTSTENKQTRETGKLGVEQFVMDMMAELEHFEITYITYDNPEELSVVDKNLTVHGPMRLLQEQKVDMMMGAMFLFHQRAKAFDYLWSHITFSDEFKIVVKTADVLPPWKNIYLEFDGIVWVLILVTYLIFVYLMLLFLQKNSGAVALMMMDYIFLHGSKLGNVSRTRWILVTWIIFAYLISTYYQSSLTSLLAHPIMMHQVASESDLMTFNVKPYLSRFFSKFMSEVAKEPAGKSVKSDCDIQLECLKRVSESHDMYTIVLHSLYLQSNWRFRDARGYNLLYPFKQPLSKIIYAIYFNKGFPLLRKFHLHALRMKESGLVDKYLADFYNKYNKCGSVPASVYSQATFNWYILAIGYSLSAACFFLEIFFDKIRKN